MNDSLIITNSIDPEKWDNFVYNHPQANIFQTREMAEVWNQTNGRKSITIAAIDSEGNICALLQAVEIKEIKGFIGLFSIISVIHGGPLYIDGDVGSNAALKIIEAYDKTAQKRALYSEIRNFWDTSYNLRLFNSLDYQFEEHLNFILTLNKNEDELLDKIEKSRRYGIRKAIKNNVTVEEVRDISLIPTVYDILHETYKIAKVPLADISLFYSAFKLLHSKNMLKIFLAKHNNNYIGTILILIYKEVAYDWFAGAKKEFLNLYPNDILVWDALKWCASNGLEIFDFGGAGKPNIAYGPREFKKQFGGKLTNYGRYKKIYSPMKLQIGKMGLKVYKNL